MLHADLASLVGTMLHERYRVDVLLGAGGMGAVFKGHHVGLDRDVAIKVLHPEFARDPSIGKRFEREATSASRLDHQNCVRVTDFGTTESGTTYLVMELLTGKELAELLGQPWTPNAMIATAKQILAGLEHAHHFGIVHRDLKPQNVIVTKDYRGEDVIKIVDFGLAKLIDEKGVEKLTQRGVVFGTPQYMSPEQATGDKLDERTDLYAAGLIFYEMLAGQGPFDTSDIGRLLQMQLTTPPPSLPDSVPRPLAKVVEKLLEKSMSNRYASAREVIAALDEAEKSGPPTLPYAVSYVPTRTGAHLGVGQLATGQHESLPFDTTATNELSTVPQRTVPIVTMEAIERRPPPPPPRAWLTWAIAGVAILLALTGIGIVSSFLVDDEAPAQAEPLAPQPSAAAEPDDAAVGGVSPEQPAPGPEPDRATISPSRSTSAPPVRKKKPKPKHE